MNHVGEIAYLAGLVRPTVALVNNAQREHQEFMRSVEATAYENGEVIAALPLSDDGVAVFPADDACTSIWRQIAGTRRVVDFAIEADAVVTATYTLRADGARVSMATPLGLVDVDLAVTGVHNVRNALAAAACAIARRHRRRIDRGRTARVPAGRRPRGAAPHERGRSADRRHLQREPRLRARRDRPAGGLRGRARAGAGRHGRGRRARPGVPPRGRGPCARARHRRHCSRSARWRAMPSTRSARAPCTAPTSTRCWPRCGHGSVRRSTVLVKGSRFMRMERVVQALAATPTGRGALSVARAVRMAGAGHPRVQRLLLPDACARCSPPPPRC